MKVRDIMSAPARTIAPDATLEEAQSLMTLHGIRHLPVVEAGEIVAVLNEEDVKIAGDGPADRKVRDYAQRATASVSPDEKLPRAANLMRSHRTGCLPVMQGAELVGIVTRSDLLARMGRHSR